MNRPGTCRADSICRRRGLRAHGKRRGPGRLHRRARSQYVLGLRAKACRSGDILAADQVQAARKEDVLDASDADCHQIQNPAG